MKKVKHTLAKDVQTDDDVDLLLSISSFYYLYGRNNQACDILKLAMLLDPKNEKTLGFLSKVLLDLGKTAEADALSEHMNQSEMELPANFAMMRNQLESHQDEARKRENVNGASSQKNSSY